MEDHRSIECQEEHMELQEAQPACTGTAGEREGGGSSFDLGIREGVGFFMSEGIFQTLIESVET